MNISPIYDPESSISSSQPRNYDSEPDGKLAQHLENKRSEAGMGMLQLQNPEFDIITISDSNIQGNQTEEASRIIPAEIETYTSS